VIKRTEEEEEEAMLAIYFPIYTKMNTIEN